MHVITPRPNIGSSLGNALGAGLSRTLNNALNQRKEQRKQSTLNDALSQARGVFEDPNLSEKQKIFGINQSLANQPQLAKNITSSLYAQPQNPQATMEENNRYEVIKKNFGERAAQLYRAAPEGGKTNFLDKLIESRQRGIDVEELLGPVDQATPNMSRPEQRDDSEEPEEEMTPIKSVDYDKGLLPKERVKRQDERYSKNLPLFQESQKKLQGLESESDSLEILNELSPQIGSLQRLNINPSTGELIIPALASPEAQRFVKTVNDFTVKAKDSFGARISNFELDRFMRRLPTLANSEEARGQIIRQMQIVNDINSAREKALQKIIEEHGGIRNIDYDRAEALAEKYVRPRIESLRKEFKTINNDLEKAYQERVKEQKAIVPKGHLAVMKADGTTGYIPQKNVKGFLKVKGNKTL